MQEETGYTVGFLNQPQSVGVQRGATLILPQPYRVLFVDLTPHYHDDFLSLCQVLEVLQRNAEFESKWVALERIREVPLPEDIQEIITHLREELDKTIFM